jgi:hypothetical protein
LLDVVLRIAARHISKFLFVNVLDFWQRLARTEEIRGRDDAGHGVRERTHGRCSEWVSWIASDEDHAAIWADWVSGFKLGD